MSVLVSNFLLCLSAAELGVIVVQAKSIVLESNDARDDKNKISCMSHHTISFVTKITHRVRIKKSGSAEMKVSCRRREN
jgi:hypothetical protein